VFIRSRESIIHILSGFEFGGYIYMFIASRKDSCCLLLILIMRILKIEFIPLFSFKILESIYTFKKSSKSFDRIKI
jgi:alpha/beta superfamily hydrolase